VSKDSYSFTQFTSIKWEEKVIPVQNSSKVSTSQEIARISISINNKEIPHGEDTWHYDEKKKIIKLHRRYRGKPFVCMVRTGEGEEAVNPKIEWFPEVVNERTKRLLT